MRYTIIAIGRMKSGPMLDLYQEYSKRITPLPKTIELEARKNLNGDALKTAEAELLQNAVPSGAYRIVLDERGEHLSSSQLSQRFEQLRSRGISDVCFLLGGADGHTQDTRQKANLILSLSALTFPHMLARVMLMEQLYRAQQISSGHPYHRE